MSREELCSMSGTGMKIKANKCKQLCSGAGTVNINNKVRLTCNFSNAPRRILQERIVL